ncbi:MAG: FtsQ-type POTRA domain-containing protein, partial [Thermoanaerobaculia bacterium]|nr:FtsQ-type POTRA domain-containing protein [Thermoanaerobaculia bacterium]
DAVTSQYIGLNLFQIDIARVQNDMRSLPWVSRIEIEKKLPGTLRMRVVERIPVALVQQGRELNYVDEHGIAFARLTPAVGDPDLPLINAACAPSRTTPCPDLVRAVALLRALSAHDPQIYSRISEVRPLVPAGFQLFDRDLGAIVYANGDDVSSKLRTLYAIVRSEQFARGSIAYADLRFSDRIVIKPLQEGAMHVQN